VITLFFIDLLELTRKSLLLLYSQLYNNINKMLETYVSSLKSFSINSNYDESFLFSENF